MKTIFTFLIFNLAITNVLLAQGITKNKQNEGIFALIDNYSLARENRDTVLLKKILMPDVDQLVSTGEWRSGIKAAVKGMLQSSASSPGTRTLTIDKIKFLHASYGIVDAKYEIKNSDGSDRKMWSTFIVVLQKGEWKISAIRNMLPSAAR
jgi:ketosteroid isomerase-like protein